MTMTRSKTIRVERLTALWALNESGLGGFLHVFNTPFTGLIVGGISILMISLIAYYAEDPWKAVLRSLIVVLLVKMAVSPHSPVGAYVAVSFQGLLGALLFSKLSWKGLSIPLLGLLTFLESAAQKLLILTIIYGTGLWEAIDLYGSWVQSKLQLFTQSSATEVLVTIYLVSYGIGGILAGFFIKSIILDLSRTDAQDFELPDHLKETTAVKKSRKRPRKFLMLWLLTISILVMSFTLFGEEGPGWQRGLYILLRSLLVLSVWYILIGPLLIRLLKSYLRSKRSGYEEQVNQTLDILPYLSSVIRYSWTETSHLKGYQRWKLFIAQSISNCIHFKI
jgi:hypothetical protein